MSLATTTAHLERRWSIQERRDPPWARWADQHPALAIAPGEIRARITDRDRARSTPVLAALVDLARHGDHQAALLVTLALLPRMVQAEAHCAAQRRVSPDSYEQLAGLLWEAIVTVTNPGVATLRESIERNVWRRKWRAERPLPTLPWDLDRLELNSDQGRRADTDPAHIAIEELHLPAVLDRLERKGAITAPVRRLLDHLAAGAEPSPGRGQSYDAARKQRWRTLARVRELPELIDALTA